MDFLNKLKGQGGDASGESHPAAQDNSAHHADTRHEHPVKPEAEPERDFLSKIIAGSGHVHTSADDDRKPEKLSLLDRLTHKEDREKKAVELAAREAELRLELDKVEHDKKENEGLFERIKERLGGGGEEEAEAGTAAAHPVEQHHEGGAAGFFDKLTGKEERQKRALELERREAELRAQLERVEDERRENEGLLQRLKDHLDGDADEAAAHGGEGDKVSFLDKITGKAAEEERLRKEEENKSALEKMKDRLNEGMGGGKKAEKNEDLLDKSKPTNHILACLRGQ